MNPRMIIAVVADYYGHTVTELMSRAQHHPLAEHRHIAMYLCRELLDGSYPTIGRVFGRDHTTVMAAVRKIKRQLNTSGPRRYDIKQLTALILARPHITLDDELSAAGASMPL